MALHWDIFLIEVHQLKTAKSEVLKLTNPKISREYLFAQWLSGIMSQEVVVCQFCSATSIRFILPEKIVEDHLIAKTLLRAVHQVTFVMYLA